MPSGASEISATCVRADREPCCSAFRQCHTPRRAPHEFAESARAAASDRAVIDESISQCRPSRLIDPRFVYGPKLECDKWWAGVMVNCGYKVAFRSGHIGEVAVELGVKYQDRSYA